MYIRTHTVDNRCSFPPPFSAGNQANFEYAELTLLTYAELLHFARMNESTFYAELLHFAGMDESTLQILQTGKSYQSPAHQWLL